MDRVDILATDPGARYGALTGSILNAAPDEELQALVREAAEVLRCPAAAITLVLEHTQLFRAQVGLSPAVAAAGAIDRDVGFCQWVVYEKKVVVVEDLADNALMPQHAVTVAGLRAYLGAPLVVSGAVIGAFAVLDTKAHPFTHVDTDAIAALAVRASARLQVLAGPPPPPAVHSGNVPTLAELRNGITPLRSDVARARVLCAEAKSLERLARAGLNAHTHALLTRAGDAAAELASVLCDVEGTARVLEDDVGLLEVALCEDDESGASLAEVVAFADGLARRLTGARGGVRWTPHHSPVAVRASRTVAAGVLAATLGEVAMRQDNDLGTDATVRVDATSVSIHLDAALDRDGARACANAMAELLGAHPSARVESFGALVIVKLARAYEC